jgi:predicted nucleotide-binding protein
MAKRTPPAPPTRTELRTSHGEARRKLDDRITKGRELFEQLRSPDGVNRRGDYKKWTSYNSTLLESLFTGDEVSKKYRWCGAPLEAFFEEPSQLELLQRDTGKMEAELHCLESIVDELELYPEAAGSSSPATRGDMAEPAIARPTRAFIVHGRDDGPREAVARFLVDLGIEPLILHEQPNRGDTIIEKLERHRDVSFAVVLLTGDDEGRLIGDADLRPRSRQNVILELGYFVGCLGRENVCALYRDDVELPSDWDGVVWVSLDERGAWKLDLARELKAAGFTIDLSNIV